jgi:hypothetical protein
VVNDLKDLMRQNVAAPPHDDLDLTALVGAGRRRARRRRTVLAGVAAGVVAGVLVGGAALTGVGPGTGTDQPGVADQLPTPDAPVIRLTDAEPAVDGTDYRVLASYTNENLNRDNGQYFDGVTSDGLILFRDGPRTDQLDARYALMDPATGAKDWLPDSPVGGAQAWAADLGTDRLVLVGTGDGSGNGLIAYVFDRTTGQWSTVQWPTLPKVDFPRVTPGPEGRLYVLTPATQGRVPEGGWPVGPDGEADDADYEGDTYHLWSVSPTDPADVRDEDLTVGDVAFTDTAMVWTDRTGDAGMVHVRDLATGEETSFDPNTGEKCNLLAFGATGDRIMMSQYCGTYAGGVRDDRVQILSTDGEQVATLQDDGVDGWLPAGSDVVHVSVFYGKKSGTYAYDLATDRFLRISDAVSSYGLGGPTGDDRQVLWHTPVNDRKGATQWLGELLG